MDYKKAYLFLFNQLSDLMQARPDLQDVIVRMQQQAEEIVIDEDELG